MLLNNSAAAVDGDGGCSPSINYCCSDSPCSSSSLALDQIPILSQYQNGNQNGNIPPPEMEKLLPEQVNPIPLHQQYLSAFVCSGQATMNWPIALAEYSHPSMNGRQIQRMF